MEIVWCFDVSTAKQYDFNLNGVFSKIADAFPKELHLLKVTSQDLKDSFLQGFSVIGFIDGEAVCHTRLIHLIDNWFELGGTYVCPEHRNQQINHKMYRIFLPKHSEKDIIATTTNPASLRVGQDIGFVTIQRKRLPEEVWRASCTCPAKKIGTNNPEFCKLAFGKSTRETGLCYFRVTPETAERHNLG
ncbi:MAG: hypothetical protein AAB565_01290 [Patescibacteria group bacterium]